MLQWIIRRKTTLMNILFVCSRNRLRSPTAEALFSRHPEHTASSCGTAPDAETPADADSIAWADLIVCMEPRHRKALQRQFPKQLARAKISVLSIPDDYAFMQPELVELLTTRLGGLGIFLAHKSPGPQP